jgi:hypothetical protein
MMCTPLTRAVKMGRAALAGPPSPKKHRAWAVKVLAKLTSRLFCLARIYLLKIWAYPNGPWAARKPAYMIFF